MVDPTPSFATLLTLEKRINPLEKLSGGLSFYGLLLEGIYGCSRAEFIG